MMITRVVGKRTAGIKIGGGIVNIRAVGKTARTIEKRTRSRRERTIGRMIGKVVIADEAEVEARAPLDIRRIRGDGVQSHRQGVHLVLLEITSKEVVVDVTHPRLNVVIPEASDLIHRLATMRSLS